MKSRNTNKKNNRHKKVRKTRKNIRKYRKGGQPFQYSIPSKQVITTNQEYIPSSDDFQDKSVPIKNMNDLNEQYQEYDIAKDAGEKVTNAVNQVKKIFTNAAEQIKNTYNNAKNKTLQQLSKVAETTQTAAQRATQKIREAQNTAINVTSVSPVNITSGGKKLRFNKSRKLKKIKKFPRHKNLQFYV